MALINGIYVFVEDESLDMNLECTEHPVEEGTEITDHIQRKSGHGLSPWLSKISVL